jgi:hypothetical protein
MGEGLPLFLVKAQVKPYRNSPNKRITKFLFTNVFLSKIQHILLASENKQWI